MKKLVQLKNKENEKLDPINKNYEKRLQRLEGVILFSGESKNESIALNDNIENYKYIEVFYYRQYELSAKTCNSTKIIAEIGRVIKLSIIWIDGNVNIHAARYQIQKNSLNYVNGGYTVSPTGTNTISSSSQPNSQITVEKIIGYK